MNLGETLVKELGLDPGVDTLGRWMAHYISEQMEFAKKAKGADKDRAEVYCFDLILTLWKHRASIPSGSRPLERFDHILRLLDRLSPENKDAHYFRAGDFDEQCGAVTETDDVAYWVGMARTIDQTARIWIDYVLNRAAKSASDEHTAESLRNAMSIEDKDDLSIMYKLLADLNLGDNKIDRRKLLTARIKKLKDFNEFNKELIASFEQDISEKSQVSFDDLGTSEYW